MPQSGTPYTIFIVILCNQPGNFHYLIPAAILRLYCLFAVLYYCKTKSVLKLFNKFKIFANNAGNIENEKH